MAVNKRTLTGIRERVSSAIDVLALYGDEQAQDVIEFELEPALKDLDYAISVAD